MSAMMGSPRNRAVLGVDNPWDDDGFYTHRKFHARRVSGTSGKRLEHRALRRKEGVAWRREIAEQTDPR